MKKTLSVLSVLALVGLGVSACGGSEGDACTSNVDCNALEGLYCNVSTGVCEASTSVNYTPVDNDEYCDGTCGTNDYGLTENCFLDEADEDQGFCSSCSVNCGVKYAGTFPVCDDASGYCVAKENPCDSGMTLSSTDGETAVCVNASVSDNCSVDTDCEGGYTCNLETHACELGSNVDPQYKYIRVDDLSPACEKDSDGFCHLDDPGADIDAIALVKSGKGTTYASTVKGYQRSDNATETLALENGKTPAVDPSKAVGEPDSFLSYATSGASDGNCVYYSDNEHTVHPYVSLGGEGGYLVVEMSEKIEAGDKIDVLEVGKCSLTNTSDGGSQKAQAEEIKVQISVNSADGWKIVGTGIADDTNKGVISFNVTADMLN